MFGCAACGSTRGSPLCPRCAASLAEGPEFATPGGVLVWAGLRHRGTARTLVHRLKYDGLMRAADVMAAAMVLRVPQTATALVPVPRAVVRRWSHGIDPACVLADAVSQRTGLPTMNALRPAVWWPRHAARGDRARSQARFRAVVPPEPTWVLIDDVATSGATLDAASVALGRVVRLALVATSPSRVSLVGLQQRSPASGDRGSGRRSSSDSGWPSLPLPGARNRFAVPSHTAAPATQTPRG